MTPGGLERGDVQYRPDGWLREDRWLIAGKTYRQGQWLRTWLAAHAGTLPAGHTRNRSPHDYGRRN